MSLKNLPRVQTDAGIFSTSAAARKCKQSLKLLAYIPRSDYNLKP